MSLWDRMVFFFALDVLSFASCKFCAQKCVGFETIVWVLKLFLFCSDFLFEIVPTATEQEALPSFNTP